MKRFFLLFVFSFSLTLAFAQTKSQQGYVKTKGRLANDDSVIQGTRLSGVTIKVINGINVVSGANGTFALMLPSAKFILENVTKKNYVLSDPDFLQKQYDCSTNDLIIVMEDEQEKANERRRIEKMVRNNLYAQTEKHLKEINRLKEEKKITEEKYRELLQKVYKDEDDNEAIIKDLVEKYSKIDFDQEGDFNRKFSVFLLKGQPMRADSLLRTKGNIIEDLKSFKAFQTVNAQKRAEQAERDTLENRSKYELADRFHKYFELFKMQHINDSAAYYLELRTTLDSTNVEWLKEAGDFLFGYVADNKRALYYYNLALKEAELQGVDISYEMMSLYVSLGLVHAALGDKTKQKECFEEAKDIAEEIHSQLYFQMIEEVETEFNVKIGDFNLPLETLEVISKKVVEKSYVYLADSYKHIAALYSRIGDYVGIVKAFEYYEEASDNYEELLEVQEKILGEEHPDVVETCINIGLIKCKLIEYDEALEYYERAQKIVNNLYGGNHPWMITIFNNMGQVYAEKGEYLKALYYFEKTVSSLENESKANQWSLVKAYNNVGSICYKLGRFSEAKDYFCKALKIDEEVLGEKHPRVGELYEKIGYVYSEQGDYPKALDCCYMGLMILERVYGEKHPVMESSYKGLSGIYVKQGDLDKALDYYQKALEINEKQNNEKSFFRAICYNDVGDIYYAKGNNNMALNYYQKALMIIEKIYDEEETIMTQSKGEDGSPYVQIKSAEYMVMISMQKKLEMTPNITTCYNNIGKVYCAMGDFVKALDLHKKALALQMENLGENHPNVQKTLGYIKELELKMEGEKLP